MEIVKNIVQLDCTKNSRAYAICGGDGVTLIDTSFSSLCDKILAELAGYGIHPADIRRILLTHRDSDHIGNAARIQALSGCEVYIGAKDLEVALGNRRAAGLKGLTSLIFNAKCPPDTKALPQGEIAGISILPTPGHSPGHSCFRFQNVLFLGDFVFSTRDRLRPAPAAYIEKKARNAAAIGRIDLTGVEWLCPAHEEPIRLC